MPDHVHMLLSIPPKYAVSQVVGFIKGKSAIHLARVYGERKRNFVGQHFWARGFFVNTVGRDEEAIRAYIRNQEREDQRLRTNEPLALTTPPSGGSKLTGRVSDPSYRFERFTSLKPPALPGDTYSRRFHGAIGRRRPSSARCGRTVSSRLARSTGRSTARRSALGPSSSSFPSSSPATSSSWTICRAIRSRASERRSKTLAPVCSTCLPTAPISTRSSNGSPS